MVHAAFLLRNTRWLVSLPAAAYLWYSRSLSMALFLAAAIVNALAVKALKRLLAQPRPAASPEQGDYGMPSSHAASLFFFALALPDSTLADAASAPASRAVATTATMGPLRTCFAAVAAVLSLHRVHGKYHTTMQVLAGSAWGAACAAAWNMAAADAYAYAAARQQSEPTGSALAGVQTQVLFGVAILVVGSLTVGSAERALRKGRKRTASSHCIGCLTS